MTQDIEAQLATCRKYGVEHVPAPNTLKVGIIRNVREGVQPLNGLRHPPEGDTTGWYLWAREHTRSDDPEFFMPRHVEHLPDWCPDVIRFLELPPGWRFLVANGYDDVWEDPSLLSV